MQNFMNPIMEKGMLSEVEVQTIFLNIETIHSVNSQLLSDFDERKNISIVVEEIGDIFRKNVSIPYIQP